MKSIVPKKRALRPREPVAVMPPSFTVDNCETVIGVKPRRLRELVTAWRIPHVSEGHLLVVRTSDWLAAIEDRSASGPVPAAQDREREQSADEILEELGFAKVGA